MNTTLSAFLIVLLVSCGEVFSRSLDNRNFYEISDTEYKVFDAANGNVEYDIILSNGVALKEDIGDFQHTKIIDQPMKKKLKNNEKGRLCVGSVMLMAMCY